MAQNGIVERLNQVLVEHTRAMLIKFDLPKHLWELAVAHTCYLKNWSPIRALNRKTPYKGCLGKRPDIRHFQTFGSACWVLKPDAKQNKLEAKSDKCVFVRFLDNGMNFRYYHPISRQVLTSQNVTFQTQPNPATPDEDVSQLPSTLEGENWVDDSQFKPVEGILNSDTQCRSDHIAKKPKVDYQKLANPLINTDTHLVYHVTNSFSPNPLTDKPRTLAEVKRCPDYPKWQEAMEKEIDQLKVLGTYWMEELPKNQKAIGCRWVFVIKCDKDGNILKHKACLVSQGFPQTPGQDF